MPSPAFSRGRATLYWRNEIEAWIALRAGDRERRAQRLEKKAGEWLAEAARIRGIDHAGGEG